MKKTIRIGAAVCVVAVCTSFSPAQQEVQTQTKITKVEPIACIK